MKQRPQWGNAFFCRTRDRAWSGEGEMEFWHGCVKHGCPDNSCVGQRRGVESWDQGAFKWQRRHTKMRKKEGQLGGGNKAHIIGDISSKFEESHRISRIGKGSKKMPTVAIDQNNGFTRSKHDSVQRKRLGGYFQTSQPWYWQIYRGFNKRIINPIPQCHLCLWTKFCQIKNE